MLRKIRISLAVFFFVCISLVFLDFTGSASHWFGWMAKIQLLPALLALNFGVLAFLVVMTLLLGRVYCSVICPLGVMQDIFAWFGKKSRKNRYSYSPARKWLRYSALAIMIAAVVLGIGSLVAILAPYSAYGRIVQNLISPVWIAANNLLASWAERNDCYTFYSVDIWIRSGIVFAIASATLIILAFLAWRNGRTYCNTICPVGTMLSFFARYSLFRPVIDSSRCVSCNLCSRNCKSACIDISSHSIDYSRCVACMDCIGKCHKNAITYSRRRHAAESALSGNSPDKSRRAFLSASAAITSAALLHAQEKTVDGGLAAITGKKAPRRNTPVVPPGAKGIRHLTQHCTACQLCVAACPNGVLRPSEDLSTLMQPRSSYERGYCRPECTRCSEVCPAGAIVRIDRADKSAIQIGHAVWVSANCIPLTDGVECGNCARHCPVGAIQMVESFHGPDAPRLPVVNSEACIGCGACENLCPARPFSAIYVEGHEVHRTI